MLSEHEGLSLPQMQQVLVQARTPDPPTAPVALPERQGSDVDRSAQRRDDRPPLARRKKSVLVEADGKTVGFDHSEQKTNDRD